MATVYRYRLTLVFVAVVAQIAGAAYGAFYAAQKLGDQKGSDEHKLISEKVFDHGFGFHTAFGYLIFQAVSGEPASSSQYLTHEHLFAYAGRVIVFGVFRSARATPASSPAA